jgi:hypothetical protein
MTWQAVDYRVPGPPIRIGEFPDRDSAALAALRFSGTLGTVHYREVIATRTRDRWSVWDGRQEWLVVYQATGPVWAAILIGGQGEPELIADTFPAMLDLLADAVGLP